MAWLHLQWTDLGGGKRPWGRSSTRPEAGPLATFSGTATEAAATSNVAPDQDVHAKQREDAREVPEQRALQCPVVAGEQEQGQVERRGMKRSENQERHQPVENLHGGIVTTAERLQPWNTAGCCLGKCTPHVW